MTMKEDDNGLLEAYEFNKRLIDKVMAYLLTNELIEETDIDDTDTTPEGAAQTFINVYERLRSKSLS